MKTLAKIKSIFDFIERMMDIFFVLLPVVGIAAFFVAYPSDLFFNSTRWYVASFEVARIAFMGWLGIILIKIPWCSRDFFVNN